MEVIMRGEKHLLGTIILKITTRSMKLPRNSLKMMMRLMLGWVVIGESRQKVSSKSLFRTAMFIQSSIKVLQENSL